MKVFLSGASGFIGGHIARKLISSGYEVNALIRRTSNLIGIKDLPLNIFTGDLLDKDSIISAMKGCKTCFHVAANYSFWEKNREIFYLANVEGTKNILDCAKILNLQKIVYTSSECTIKLDKNENNKEEFETKLNDVSDVFGDYKKTKILAEIEVRKYIQIGLPIVIVAPTTPIGTWDIKPTPTGKIILDFMLGKMSAYVNTGLNIIDVENVAEGHILALENGVIGEKYVLGNKNLTLKQIFDILSEITKIKSPNIKIPLWLALSASYFDEFIKGKILKRAPSIPISAVKAASKFRFFDCTQSVNKLGVKLNPVEEAFEKAVRWFKDFGYVS